jgi:F-type H+-transporting ATPase subunit epsilon|tara:strand:- start:2229 stop:2624 length:396 start_codon:yes stop_codon:yes gene_type:complete
MSTFNLEIVTPTQVLKKDNVSYLRCPGMDGLFGVLSGHRDALIALNLGEIKISQDKNELVYATSGGFAEISGDKVELLVETIEESENIDKQRAEASLERAKGRLKSIKGIDPKRAELSLARALNRLAILRR